MKAWMTRFSGEFEYGSLLVFAESRNQARFMSTYSQSWLYEWDYIDISATRMQAYDKYADGEKIIETNDELPEGAPDFYDDNIGKRLETP